MGYGCKFTTNGLAVLAACADGGKPLKLTRVSVGNGVVTEGTNLADVHRLVHYVAEGSIGDRRHQDNTLWINIQYSNRDHPEVGVFYLSEFIVYAENPETGGETDLIYASLGEYRQPVPSYTSGDQAAVFTFPVSVVLSDEVEVYVDAEPGLVTYAELEKLLNEGELGVASTEITIPALGWEPDDETGGVYRIRADIPVEGVTVSMVPQVTIPPEGLAIAEACGLGALAQTLSGRVRMYAVSPPSEPIRASLVLMGLSPYASARMTLKDYTAGEAEALAMIDTIFNGGE